MVHQSDVISMGLNTGNKSPIGEANIHNDPEAAKIVYGSFPDITMAGLRVTHQVGLNILRERLRKEAGPVGQFMFDISEHYCKFLQGWGHPKQSVHDASAVRQSQQHYCSTVGYIRSPQLTRGHMLG